MTLDDLWDITEAAHDAYQQFRGDCAHGRAERDAKKEAKLKADASFLLQCCDVWEKHGKDAAMLFRLSDGNIDPRHPAR